MSDRAEAFLARIQAMAPDLAVRSAVFNGEGLMNDVVIVNDRLVFRFAKGERGLAAMDGELRVLARVKPLAGGPAGAVRIPVPFFAGPAAMAYEILPGEPLSNSLLRGLDDEARQAVAGQLGDFLRQLHAVIDEAVTGSLPPATRMPVSRAAWAMMQQQAEAAIFPLLLPHQQAWAHRLFDGLLAETGEPNAALRLIHGDLWPEHILFDRAAGRLSGIIDFGMAGSGDPATDLGHLLQVYGERFVRLMLPHYPEAGGLLRRARLYAEALELDWVLRGLSSGDQFWFAAHLGNARDIGRK